MDAYSLATEYLDLGYDAIPLQAGTKEAACKGWQQAAPIATHPAPVEDDEEAIDA